MSVRKQRLVWPARPAPYESVASVVFNAAVNNVHDTTAWLLETAGSPHHAAYGLAVTENCDDERLAAALRIPVAEVSLRRHRPIGDTGLVDFFGAAVPTTDLILRRRRFCPQPPDALPIQRAIWEHGLLPFCSHSGIFLVSDCATCGKVFGWIGAKGMAVCEHCGAQIKASECDTIGIDAIARTATITAILDPDPAVHRPAVRFMHGDLQELNRGDAFELAWSIGRLAANNIAKTTRDRDKMLPRASLVEILGHANRVLVGWPDSVRSMVQESVASLEIKESALMLGLRKLGSQKYSRPAVSELVRRSFPFAQGRGNTILTGLDVGRCDPAEAAAMVGLSTGDFAELARAGIIHAIGQTGEKRRHGTYARNDDTSSLVRRVTSPPARFARKW